jgi:hypothetical protein
MSESKSAKLRHGNTMVTVTTKADDAVVDYESILEAVQIDADDMNDAPWQNCDGFEHEAIRGRQLEAWKYGDADVDAMRGHGHGDRDEFLIRVDPADVKKWGIYDYMRAKGASKQVARELEAVNLRRTIDQIVKWYSEGWSYYYVNAKFRGYTAGVGGVDDYDYADGEMRGEIADEIAHDMEKDGYTIENRPPEEKRFKNGYTLAGWKDHLKRNVHLFDVSEDKD